MRQLGASLSNTNPNWASTSMSYVKTTGARVLAVVVVPALAAGCGTGEEGSADRAQATHGSESGAAEGSHSLTSQQGSGSPTEYHAPPCAKDPYQLRGTTSSRIYFYCVNELSPVPWEPPSDGDALTAVVRAFANGPTREQRAIGYHGGLMKGTRFEVSASAGRIIVDLDGSSFDIELFQANHAFPVTRPLSRSLEEFAAGMEIDLLIDGRTLCSLDDECSG